MGSCLEKQEKHLVYHLLLQNLVKVAVVVITELNLDTASKLLLID